MTSTPPSTTAVPIPGVRIEKDIVYGSGRVGHGTAEERMRPLLLNVYLPEGQPVSGPRPALILTHGGSYHRGSKDTDEFEQDGSHNTPMPEYCKRFAARGYVCFSVGYRLTQELPGPQDLPIKRDRQRVTRGRIDYVRELLGLPPASDAELLQGSEAVFQDVAQAFRFVQTKASRWQINPDRIAMGGFSSGAFASLYAAYALGMPAAAIVSVSGGMEVPDVQYYVQGTRGKPPVLMFSSEHDLPGICERTQAFADAAVAAGIGLCQYHVPGKSHFYDRGSPVELRTSTLDGAPQAGSLESVLIDFLERTIGPAQVTTDMPEANFQGDKIRVKDA